MKNILPLILIYTFLACSNEPQASSINKLSEQSQSTSAVNQQQDLKNNPNNLPVPSHEMAKSIDPKKFPNYMPWEKLKGLELIKEKKKVNKVTKVSIKFKPNEEIKKLVRSKKKIKLLGFMVPLDYNDKTILEFLLIPNPMSCSHVPPPRPNQMVLVKMKKDTLVQYHWGPVWVDGILSLAKEKDVEEEMPSFEMEGLSVLKYDQSKLPEDVQKTIKQGTP